MPRVAFFDAFGGEMEGPEEKGDFFSAWGGISSVGLGLPILWTEGKKRDEQFSIEDVVRWCCKNTALQVGLEKSKGDLGVGFDADIVVFDDTAEFLVCSISQFELCVANGVDRLSLALCSSGTKSRRTRTRRSVVSCARRGCAAIGSSRERTGSRRRQGQRGRCCLSLESSHGSRKGV